MLTGQNNTLAPCVDGHMTAGFPPVPNQVPGLGQTSRAARATQAANSKTVPDMLMKKYGSLQEARQELQHVGVAMQALLADLDSAAASANKPSGRNGEPPEVRFL